MLLQITTTFANGDVKKMVINSAVIKEIESDTREGVPSRAIIYTTAEGGGRRYYVAETLEQLTEALGL